MELTNESITKWMDEYFDVYAKYGQVAETANRMHKYFAPDLRFIPYIAPIGGPEKGFHTADEFIQTAVRHTAWYEKLTPLIYTVDEKRKSVVVMFTIDVYDRQTGKVAVTRTAMSHYELMLDQNKDIKIKTIRFFWEVLPTTVKEFFELFPGR
jgi:hypothetical protein